MDTLEEPILAAKRQKALALLDHFSTFTDYRHGKDNPFLKWLALEPTLSVRDVVTFFNFWYPLSRRQPQILLRCAAEHSEQADRKLIMLNYREEDGLVKLGDQPHYSLLEKLILKLGGELHPDEKGQALMNSLFNWITKTVSTPAEASGVLGGLEHPALDISWYFRRTVTLCGFPELLRTDPYLTIHVAVEPDHIIWSHGNAMRYLEGSQKAEFLKTYQKVMSFWQEFWPQAFAKLGYQPESTTALRGNELFLYWTIS